MTGRSYAPLQLDVPKINTSTPEIGLNAKIEPIVAGNNLDDGFGYSSKSPTGRSGTEIQNFEMAPRNSPAIIDGVKFTGHALDQMQNRGIISPTAVLDAMRNPTQVLAGNRPGTWVHFKGSIKVMTN